MKLELSINRRDAINLFDSQCINSTLTVNSDDSISATISLDPGEYGGDFVLAVGGEPDISALAQSVTPNCQCAFEWRKERGQYVRFFPLFYATVMGATKLWLANETHPFRHEWDVYVRLAPNDPRPALYEEMVRELLEKGFPHEVVDDFKGQMKHHGFLLDWQDGYASRESAEVVLDELQKVVSEMRPLLHAICRTPRLDVVPTLRLLPLAKAPKADARLRRGMKHVGAKIGGCPIEQVSNQSVLSRLSNQSVLSRLSNQSVLSRCKKVSPGRNVHAVLFMFLHDFVLRRSERIRTHFDNLPSRQPMWWPGDKAKVMKEREILAGKASLAKQVSDTVRVLLTLPVFCDIQKQLNFFDVAPEEFTHTEAYARLYEIMLRFIRARFWWVGDEGDGWWKMPRLSLNETGSTRWERKYSMIYENWCHAHLIRAFHELGYEGREEAKPLPGCTGSCWSFRKGDIEVFVQHGVKAEAFVAGTPRAFVLMSQIRNSSTPDFAIVVKRGEQVEWFVADAKSDEELRARMVEKRCWYAQELRWAMGGYAPHHDNGHNPSGKEPFASILIRSGPTGPNDEPAAVEIPPTSVQDFNGNDHSNDDYGWCPVRGVMTRNSKPPYHGHLRVNVVSIKKRPDIFREFVEGMVATACRHICENEK